MQRAVGQPHPELRGIRSPFARELGPPSTGSESSSGRSPTPKVAPISGANVSMSGHMTITSRGSSDSSDASRMQDRVAEHLHLTDATVAGVHLTVPLVNRQRHPLVGLVADSVARARARSSRMSALQPAEQRPAGSGSLPSSWSDPLAGVRPSTSCISRASRPHEASSLLSARCAVRSVDPLGVAGGSLPPTPAIRSHSVGRRVQQEQMDVPVSGERAQDLRAGRRGGG